MWPFQECCNSPYGNTYFPEYAEPVPGPSTEAFAQAAKDNNVYLVAGGIQLIGDLNEILDW